MNNIKNYDVAIIGAGPAGIFTAYQIIKKSYNNSIKDLKIAIIDKGRSIFNRKCPLRDEIVDKCINCNPCGIMSGFGGAGTFSDCKLSLTPDIGGNILNYIDRETATSYIKEVENIIANFDRRAEERRIIGLPSKDTEKIKTSAFVNGINYIECPTKHLGTDGTFEMMKNMQMFLEKQECIDLLFNTTVENVFSTENNKFIIETNKDNIQTNNVVIAVGRSGSGEWLHKISNNVGFDIEDGNADIGVRVETDAEITDRITDILYDMKFSYFDPETRFKARTFCTNPKGYVSEEHYNGNLAVANGHSFADKKSDRTNFAILVTTDYPSYEAINVVKKANIENHGKLIVQNLVDFTTNTYASLSSLRNKNYGNFYPFSYPSKFRVNKNKMTLKTATDDIKLSTELSSDINLTIARFIKKLDVIMPGIYSDKTYLYGIEAKFYSDKVITDDKFETKIKGVYCIGDGAGITRGIIQSGCTGLIVGEDIITKLIKDKN